MSVYKTNGVGVGKKCKFKTCKKCGDSFPTRVYISGKSRDLSCRGYCLNCSPFGQRNNKQLEKARTDGLKTCSRCLQDIPVEQFMRESQKTGKIIIREGRCETCRSEYRSEKGIEFKQKCVDYKGGKCVECGYNKCLNALSFHHLDPSQKDFEISRIRWMSKKTFTKALPELDKCALLCLNCHAEAHAKIISPTLN